MVSPSLQIVITGANRGIGFSLTRDFLKAGHRVVATARKLEEAQELKALLREADWDSRLRLLELDVRSDASANDFAQSLRSETIDILVNNAGLGSWNAWAKTSAAELAELYDVNAIGSFRVTQALLARLKPNGGKIFFMSSAMGSMGDGTSGGAFAYRMSKSALNMLSCNLSTEVKSQGIASIALHPGWVQTDMGGRNATLSVEQSSSALVQLMLERGMESTGQFLSYEGKNIPW